MNKGKNIVRLISDFFLRIEHLCGGLVLTFISGVAALVWRLDEDKYPDFSWAFEVLTEKRLFVVIFGCVGTALFLQINKRLREASYKKLKDELNEATQKLDQVSDNIDNLFNGRMLSLSDRFGFEKNTKARLSLYINDTENEQFVPCGRYSPDPTYRSKGRGSFSYREGCIWKCWEDDFHFDNEAPNGRSGYRKYQSSTFNIDKNVIEGLKMRPRLIAGKRIDDKFEQPIGVIILEAMKPDEFEEHAIREVMEASCNDIARMILTLKEYIPKPGYAKGFGL